MIKVGITGNIGSGKTLSGLVFKKLGIPVFEADIQAKQLYLEEEIKGKMCEKFGPEIYLHDGQLNRFLLANKLFDHADAVAFINNLIHPAVRQKFKDWSRQHLNKPYLIYEAAILFETGYYKKLDSTILVSAPLNLRMKRVVERDQITRDEIKKRMQYQWPEEKKIPLANFVINNDGDSMLIPQVLAIHRKLLSKSEAV